MSTEGDASNAGAPPPATHPAQLVIIVTAERGPLAVNLPPSGTLIIGRGVDADVFVASDDVSRRHAQLDVAGLEVTVRDLDSRNGTFVNGVRIKVPRVLSLGDEIRIAEARIVIKRATAAPPAPAASRTQRERMAHSVTQRSKPGQRD